MMSGTQYTAKDDRKVLGSKPYFSHSVRPSRSSSQSRSDGRDETSADSTARYAYGPRIGEGYKQPQQSRPNDWIPYTLRHQFMGLLSLVALALCLITFLLWWKSSTNYGLGFDNGSSALLFGWRYTPTLITVIYVQLTAMLFIDVRRTEPFARLARPEGADASCTVLDSAGFWWTTLWEGITEKKNGRRSWVLVCAELVNIFGFLAISTLSSAYLYSEDLVVPQATQFYRQAPLTDSPLPIHADPTTHFRTIANLLRNVSTSPWITDQYTILPVWPASLHSDPINSLPATSSETWQAETTVFKSELSCSTMTVDSVHRGQYSIHGYAPAPGVSIVWSFPDSCKYGLMTSMDF